jgi:hypothetical protein
MDKSVALFACLGLPLALVSTADAGGKRFSLNGRIRSYVARLPTVTRHFGLNEIEGQMGMRWQRYPSSPPSLVESGRGLETGTDVRFTEGAAGRCYFRFAGRLRTGLPNKMSLVFTNGREIRTAAMRRERDGTFSAVLINQDLRGLAQTGLRRNVPFLFRAQLDNGKIVNLKPRWIPRQTQRDFGRLTEEAKQQAPRKRTQFNLWR